LLLLLVTVFIHPEAWFARYVPQLWAVPMLAATLGLSSLWRGSRACAVLVVVLALINVLGIGLVYYPTQFRMTLDLQAQIAELKQRPSPIEAAFQYPYGRGFAATLGDFGLHVKVVESSLCQGRELFAGKRGRICSGIKPEPGNPKPQGDPARPEE